MKAMMIQLPHFYEGAHRPPAQYPLGIGYLVSVLKNDHEFMRNKIILQNRVNKNYYHRHPLNFMIMQMERIKLVIKKALYNPRYIINKLRNKMIAKSGGKERVERKAVKIS
jgi:hypothetical protein